MSDAPSADFTPSGVAFPRTATACGIAAVLLGAAAIYLPVTALPLMNEAPVEQALSAFNPFDFFLRSAYLEEGSGIYYRFGTRLIDHVINRLNPGAEPAFWNHAVQLLMHLAVAGLTALFVALRTGWRSPAPVVAALVPALHPSIAAAVAATAVRWSLSSVLTFLILACVYQVVLKRAFREDRSLRPLAFASAALAPLVLFLALIAEVGAVCTGALGVWLAAEFIRRRDARGFMAVMLPLAPVPLLYALIRVLSLGALSRSYYPPPETLAERLRVYAGNFTYDLQLLLNPLPTGVFLPDGVLRGAAVMAVLAGLILLALLLPKNTRRGAATTLLPAAGFGVFVLFQLNALWLVPKLPVHVAGVDRGYPYVLPVVLLGILAGGVVGSVHSGGSRRILYTLLVVAALWAVAAGVRTRQAVELWADAGAMMERHEAELTPVLRDLDPDVPVYVRGFPVEVRVPYLPRALAYYHYTHDLFLTEWAGRPVEVIASQVSPSLPTGFRGLVAFEDGGELRIWRESPETRLQRYLERIDAGAPGGPLVLLDRLRNPDEGELVVARFSVTPEDNGLRLRSEGTDPWVAMHTAIKPADWGFLTMTLRAEPADGAAEVPVQVYFRTENEPFAEERSFLVTVPAGRETDVRIPLFTEVAWTDAGGEIAQLRLDLLPAQGEVLLRELRLENDAAAARQLIEVD